MKKLSIIIPVFNEEATIYKLLGKINDLDLIENVEKEIIVVNDCSTDSSKLEIDRFAMDHSKLNVIHQQKNLGKGGAIHTGVDYATGEYIIIQDADLELNPEDINRLLLPIIKNEADVVYGSRFLERKVENQNLLSKLANQFLTKLSNVVFGIKITDMETCYKLVPSTVFKSLILKEQRFGFEPEITAKLAKNKTLRWKEVAISYFPRTEDEGKKIGWKDGVQAIQCILKYGWFTSKQKSYKSE